MGTGRGDGEYTLTVENDAGEDKNAMGSRDAREARERLAGEMGCKYSVGRVILAGGEDAGEVNSSRGDRL